MNRQQLVQARIWLDQVAAAAKAKADELTAQLAADAKAEYDEQGTVPRWRIPDIATVSASVSKGTVSIVDEKAFERWVAERHPDEIETVARVRGSFASALMGRAEPVAGEGAVCDPETDEVIPGLTYRPGGRFLGVTVRPSHEAKQLLGLAAQEGLKRAALEAGPSVPLVLAELPQ